MFCGNRFTKRNKAHKDRHIKFAKQDSDSSSLKSVRVRNKKVFIWQAAVSAFLLLHALLPNGVKAAAYLSFLSYKLPVAHAQNLSLFSYHSNSNFSLQDMPLLSADSNSLLSSIGGSELTVLDGSVLAPSKGPKSSEIAKDIQKGSSDAIKVYVVQKGDTLSEIAEKFGVSVNTIRWANDLGRNGLIKVGQELVILPIDGVKYKVKHGGTLRDIVKKIGGDVEEAAVFNGIDPDEELAAGTEVIVPGAEIKEKKLKASRVKSFVRNYGTGKTVYKGYFMRPVKGGVKTQGLHGKNAVDIAAGYGTAIYAAASGRVIISKYGAWNGGYGNYIVIAHPNGTQTLYAHLAKNLVKRGDYVSQGQIIGTMGSTGKSTGVHLHFEVRGAKNPF